MEKVVSLDDYKVNRLQHLKDRARRRFKKKLEIIRETTKQAKER